MDPEYGRALASEFAALAAREPVFSTSSSGTIADSISPEDTAQRFAAYFKAEPKEKRVASIQPYVTQVPLVWMMLAESDVLPVILSTVAVTTSTIDALSMDLLDGIVYGYNFKELRRYRG